MNDEETAPHSSTGAYHTGNIPPLLHEVGHALGKLLASGESTAIDLRSLPMAPGEQDELLELLGKGEISATLEALGTSEIIETAYAGVWLIFHYNDNREVMGKFIEITRIPAILESHTADIEEALTSLQSRLNEL
jgi:hydrogenase-1 operon protein HyaF